MNYPLRFLLLLILFLSPALSSRAQPLVNIETVTVGDPGNAGNYGAEGSVAYEYDIGKYEVTLRQYVVFLNSVARTPTNSYITDLWNPSMTTDPNSAGIQRSGSGVPNDPYIYSVIGSDKRPVTYVSRYDAVRFCNWLHNGATNGADTEDGAYPLEGRQSDERMPPKNNNAGWWLPTASEWVKAAHYKGGSTDAGYWLYPTRSDMAPGNVIGALANQANYFANDYSITQNNRYSTSQNYITEVGAYTSSPSPYGTFDQGGNVGEYFDSDVPEFARSASWKGGGWDSPTSALENGGSWSSGVGWESADVGFRVARTSTDSPPPAPTTNAILTLEMATNLTGDWQSLLIGPEMITQDGKLDVGAFTNRAGFYRMRIKAVTK